MNSPFSNFLIVNDYCLGVTTTAFVRLPWLLPRRLLGHPNFFRRKGLLRQRHEAFLFLQKGLADGERFIPVYSIKDLFSTSRSQVS